MPVLVTRRSRSVPSKLSSSGAELLDEFGWELAGFDALYLEVGARGMDGPIRNKVMVGDRFVVAVVEGRQTVGAVEEGERVVVEEIGRRRGQADLQGVEVLEDCAVARVDGAVALVGEDEIESAGRETRESGDHRGISGGEDPRGGVHLPGFDPGARNVGEMFLKRVERLFHQLAAIREKEDTFDPFATHEQLHECHGDARLSGARGHHEQELAATVFGALCNFFHRIRLVGAIDDPFRDRCTRERLAVATLEGEALKIIRRKKPADPTRRAGWRFHKPELITIAQEDEWRGGVDFGNALRYCAAWRSPSSGLRLVRFASTNARGRPSRSSNT